MAEDASPKPGSELDASADRIRETAKWLIVSFAGVGSVLVAGSQLSSLGSLEPWSDRFLVALAGVAVALVAVVVAIYKVSTVLVLDPLSLRTLATSRDATVAEIRRDLEGDDSLVPRGSLDSLYKDYHGAVVAQLDTYDAYRAGPTPSTLGTAQGADAYAQTQSALAQNVLAVARLLRVSKAFKDQRKWLFGMTVVGAAGIVTFAAAANPPEEPAPEPAPAPALVREGSSATIMLTETGKTLLQPRLREGCNTDALRVFTLDVARAGIDVVTMPTRRCNGIRFTLTPLLGSVTTPKSP
jgi:hypothetical protein